MKLLPGLLAGLVALGAAPIPLLRDVPPTLEVVTPAAVQTGQPVRVGLVVRGAPEVAGLELTVGFDPATAHFSGWTPPRGIEAGAGLALPAVESAEGVSLGYAGCQTVGCAAPADQPAGVRVAEVVVVPDRAGRLVLDLSGVKAVDATGGLVALALEQSAPVTVTGDAGQGLRDPVEPRFLDTRVGQGGRPTRGPADLSDDEQVTAADVPLASAAWSGAREGGGACRTPSPADRNSDGCVDIADVQAQVAAVTDPTGSTRLTVARSAAVLAQSDPAVFTVNASSDSPDRAADGLCATSAGTCTLRAAITEANRHSGPDRIQFNIPGGGVRTIQLASTLPTVTDGGLMIDGYTQPGARPNSDPTVSNAVITVAVRGKGATSSTGGGYAGLYMTSAGNTVRGLALYDLNRAIRLYGSGARDNVLAGNFLGTDPAANYVAPGFTGGASGVHLQAGANRNRIGGILPADRNVISGNAQNGVALYDNDTDFNVIQGNLVGLAPSGTRAVRNHSHGIDLNTHASDTVIGGTGPGERNVVSGNGFEGIEVSHGLGTLRNRVIGNHVGTNPAGTAVTSYSANGRTGIHIEDLVTDNVVSDNVVGGNGSRGITLDGYDTTGNSFTRNWIGVTPGGTPIANAGGGILVTFHASDNTFGPDNTIANNPVGIEITGDVDNDRIRITRNRMYANTGLGIDLHPLGQVNPNDAGDSDSGPNQQLNYPVFSTVSSTSAQGSACAGCTVEVFLASADPSGHGEGRDYLTSATADSGGRFSAPLGTGAGGRSITATASTGDGNTSEFARNVLVPTTQTTPPRAVFASSCQGLTCTFDGSQSEDPDGAVTQWAWSFGDGATGAGTTVTYTYPEPGSYDVTLTVTDDFGATDQTSGTVDVTASPPSSPEPSPEPSPSPPSGSPTPEPSGPPQPGPSPSDQPSEPGPSPDPSGPEPTGTPAPGEPLPPVNPDRETVRLAGSDRIETAAQISRESFAPDVEAAYVTTGSAFPDALTAGPAAAAMPGPVLLVDRILPQATEAELERLRPRRIVIVGGELAVSPAIEAALDRYTDQPVERQAGIDRYHTAVAVSRSTAAHGGTIYVATGESFPDALAGGVPAGLAGGPVLLVGRNQVPEVVAEELRRIVPAQLIILGGPAAVSDEVQARLGELTGVPIIRLAGGDRFETAAAVSAATFPDGAQTVFAATGANFADALAGVPPATLAGAPILLVTQGQVPAATARELARLDPQRVVILGGIAAVSVQTAERLASRE